MSTDRNQNQSKEYKRGTKNSWDKTTKTFKLSNSHLEFMDLFIELKKEQGYHKLAFTRTDLIETAIANFAEDHYNDVFSAKEDLKNKFLENKLVKEITINKEKKK